MLITFEMKNQKPEVIDLETESKMIAFNQALAHSRKLCDKYDCTVKFLMEDGHSFTIEKPEKNNSEKMFLAKDLIQKHFGTNIEPPAI